MVFSAQSVQMAEQEKMECVIPLLINSCNATQEAFSVQSYVPELYN
jgi:hypothetical protein